MVSIERTDGSTPVSVPPAPFVTRSILFFPASRPRMFGNALASGADAVCMDLEDSVPFAEKDDAREQVRQRIADRATIESQQTIPGLPRFFVRVNSLGTAAGEHDLEMMAGVPGILPVLVLPKVDSPDSVRRVQAALSRSDRDVAIIPLLETAVGLERAADIARGSRAVAAIGFGGVDLAAELGSAAAWEPLLYARSRIVHAAAVAGVTAIDMPHLDLSDSVGLVSECRAARRLGFAGKFAIHPRQVAWIQSSFSPSQEEIKWAESVLRDWDGAAGGVTRSGGQMVDLPVARSALRIIAVAKAIDGRTATELNPQDG